MHEKNWVLLLGLDQFPNRWSFNMKIVKLSVPEATELLHLLRSIHMTVGEAREAVPPEKRDDLELFSMPMMGALSQAVSSLEGSIYEANEEDGFDPFNPSIN